MRGFVLKAVGIVCLIAQLFAGSSLAEEPTQNVSTSSTAVILVPGRLAGIETFGPLGHGRLCSPRSIGIMEWQVGFLRRQIKPTGPQMELLNKLQAASTVAKNAIASSCGNEKIETGPAHLAAMEQRLTALLNLVGTLKEPYEAFYASLDDRQKIILDSLGPGRRGWRW
jgi:LTXXQ motif family protein